MINIKYIKENIDKVKKAILHKNVDCDLDGFNLINPCGLLGTSVGRLSDWIPGLNVVQVSPLMRRCLRDRFDLNFFCQETS